MQTGITKMAYRLYRNQIMSNYRTKSEKSGLNIFPPTSRWLHLFIFCLIMLISSKPAFSQFLVQPMIKELDAKPGTLYPIPLDIDSLEPNSVITATLKIVDLGQSEDGSWRIVDTDPQSMDYDPSIDISKLSSCSRWMTLSRTSVSIQPGRRESVNVKIKVPRNISGYYFAGIVVTAPPRPDATGVAMIVRFLVPFIIHVEGRSLRANVKITDIRMKYVPANASSTSTALVMAKIDNNGPTYSSIKPFTRVWRYQEGHWRVIKTKEFNNGKIIPGANLILGADIMRSLPTGKYKVHCGLYVDAQRVTGLEKIFDFVGDPTITRASTEAPLDLVPDDVIVKALPGSSRSEKLTIRNASDEKINVKFDSFTIPEAIKNQIIKDLDIVGNEMDCSSWLKMEPHEFSLNSYDERNVSISVVIPESAKKYPCYYGLLNLSTSYPDGQVAGSTTSNICVLNQSDKEGLNKISLQGTTVAVRDYDPSFNQFLIIAEFANKGKVHFDPVICRAAVAQQDGSIVQSTSLNSDRKGLILPFEKRLYSGIIDLTRVSTGTYRVEVYLEDKPEKEELDGKKVKMQIVIQVSVSGNRKTVSVIRTKDEIQDLVEVKW
jgi:hypothetical protein